MDIAIEHVIDTLSLFYRRIPLGTFPTPVLPISLPGLGSTNIWIKRDDLSSSIYGGNKVRKLEFILGQSKRPVLTFGPLGSHHVYSTACHAKSLGRRTAAVLVPQHMTRHHEKIHREILKLCDPVFELIPNPRSALTLIKSLSKIVGHREFKYQICPPGGSSALGTLGYVIGALELALQIREGKMKPPQKVFVPLGTGGTAVGIAIGFAMAGINTQTMAVRVVPKLALPKFSVSLLILRTLRLIGKAGLAVPKFRNIRLEIQGGFSNKYAVTTPEADNALWLAKQSSVDLETTYSAKAMAALISTAQREQTVNPEYLFWQTYAKPDFFLHNCTN